MKEMISSLSPGLLISNSAATVSCAPARARFSLRASDGIDVLGHAIGIDLPQSIGQRSESDSLEALKLGPDEWVLLADDPARVIAASESVYQQYAHSLVDVSGRECVLEIGGPCATELLTIGMPRDPETIGIGEGRRTVFDGFTVVLWRDDVDKYRLDAWNSFVSQIYQLLETGCRELAAEKGANN